jgi:DNA-binding response OmpR family regulator
MGGSAAPAFLGGEVEGRASKFGPKRRRLSAVGGGRPSGTPGRSLSVLVVEDDASMRLLVTVNLELAGFRVTAAATGAEGLELAESEKPDLVLLDVMLPDLGGFEVAERLPEIPIVFMSARTSESDIERGRGVGAIDYVTKPFDPMALPGRLREDLKEFDRGGAERVWALRFGPKG